MKIKNLLYLLAMFMALPVRGFNALPELQKFIEQYPEYPDADSSDWSNPSFINFRKSLASYKQSFWQPQDFANNLHKVLARLEGRKEQKRIIGTALGAQGARFIVWSDLHGAFHSLVRALVDLREQNVIDDTLTITAPAGASPDTYMVFNGNVAEGSPYILETLTLIFLLAEHNPGKVFYLKGEEEDMQRWQDRGLSRQLIDCCSTLNNEKVPFAHELDTYFKKVAYAIYVTDAEKKHAVRIAPQSQYVTEDFEAQFPDFFASLQPGQLTHYSFFESKRDKLSITLDAVLEGISTKSLTDIYQPLVHERRKKDNALVWRLCSGQTRRYRQLYQFFYDAYVILDFKSTFAASTLTLRARNVRKPGPFVSTCYKLLDANSCTAS